MENYLKDETINGHIESRSFVSLFLINGVRLDGVITEYDGECLKLYHNSVSQLVFTSALATIMPKKEEGLR